jgi:hypothetical protein
MGREPAHPLRWIRDGGSVRLLGRYHARIPPAASAVGCEARFGGSLRLWGGPAALPACGFVDLASGVGQHGRELAGGEYRGAQLLEEGWLQGAASPGGRMRVDDADAETELALGDLDRQLQVGVVRDHDRDIAVALEGVEEQEGGEVESEPFSSVFTTSTVRAPPRRGRASGMRVR